MQGNGTATKVKRSSSVSRALKQKTPEVESKAKSSPSQSKTNTPRKRKARASTVEPDSRQFNGNVDSPAGKRIRRGGTPGAGGSKGVKKETPGYVVRKGFNALPAPIPAITKAIFQAGLAPTATSGISAQTPANVKALEHGEILAREMFVFGNGDMGQHGLGTEALDEIKRPRRHAWVAKANEEGKLGKGGLEMIAAGGMHSLAIDSTGRVSLTKNQARHIYIYILFLT